MLQVEALKGAIASCIAENDAACKDLNQTELVTPVDVEAWFDALPSTSASEASISAFEDADDDDVDDRIRTSRIRINGAGGVIAKSLVDLNSSVTEEATKAKRNFTTLLDASFGPITVVSQGAY